MRRFVGLISITTLFACVGATGRAAAPGDIIAARSADLTLGPRWYPIEHRGGTTFRWVDSGAELVVHRPKKTYDVVNVTLEGGPGLGTMQFPFIVRDASNRQIDGVFVRGHETISLVLPTDPHGDNRFTLSAIGGGHRVPSDKRILNFRVFAIDDGATTGAPLADIGGNGVRIGNGWYPLETFAGQTFRWVRNDAHFTLDWPRDQRTTIRAIVEPGPGVGDKPFTLVLQSADGKTIGSAPIKGRAIANIGVDLRKGMNAFRLHVDGGGLPAKNDKRTLNFRVFALSALE